MAQSQKSRSPLLIGLGGALIGAAVIYFLVPRQPPTTGSPQAAPATVSNVPVVDTNQRTAPPIPPSAGNAQAVTATTTATNPPAGGALAKAIPPLPSTNALAKETIQSKGAEGVQNTGTDKPVPPPVPPPYGDVYVLSIGVNGDGTGLPALRFAAKDAVRFAAVMSQRLGFTNTIMLTNEVATKDRVNQELDRLQQMAESQSRADRPFDLIVFFSGHGMTVSKTIVKGGRTNEQRHGFLIPHAPSIKTNSGLPELQQHALGMAQLAARLQGFPARHRILLLDSCFSGLAYVPYKAADHKSEDLYPDIIKSPTVQILTAGLDQEAALEDAKGEEGVFTGALLDELSRSRVLTVEELFFPLRAGVRDRLRTLGEPNAMTPQHRFLVYDRGTFVFVPPDKIEGWAAAKPTSPEYVKAGAKGYFRPVSASDATNVVALTTLPENEREEIVERYEVRAAMGDPQASLALAQIYQRGIGVPANPRRAKLFIGESRDYMTAAGTLDVAGLVGIDNPIAAGIVNNLVRVNMGGGNGLPGIPGPGNAGGTGVGIFQMAKLFGAGGGADPERTRQDILKLIDQRKYKDAADRLSRFEQQVREAVGRIPAGGAPPELDQMRERVGFARKRIELNLPTGARKALEDLGPIIQQLVKKSQPSQ